jgi:hypothetical protein
MEYPVVFLAIERNINNNTIIHQNSNNINTRQCLDHVLANARCLHLQPSASNQKMPRRRSKPQSFLLGLLPWLMLVVSGVHIIIIIIIIKSIPGRVEEF